MNVQVLTDPFGRLLRAPPAPPGSTHAPTTAQQHGIIEALTEAGLRCRVGKAYQDAGGPVCVPFRGPCPKRWQRRHHTTHAKIRRLGEQVMAALKGGRLLRKPYCSTSREGAAPSALHPTRAHHLTTRRMRYGALSRSAHVGARHAITTLDETDGLRRCRGAASQSV